MIQSTVRWLRVTWPPWWVVALYFLCQGACAWGYFGLVLPHGAVEAAEAILIMRRMVACLACVG